MTGNCEYIFFSFEEVPRTQLSVREMNMPTVLRMDEDGNWRCQEDSSEISETRRVPEMHTSQLKDADI